MGFLSIEQAAEQLGLGVHGLRANAKAGKLPGARKIGGRWFVHRATLEKFFESSLPAQELQSESQAKA
jgi:excisionase family DNA binding protein